MLSNIPPSLILAALVALVALPFVVVACSVYLADRIVSALRPIFRLLKEQAAAGQRLATAIPAATVTVPVPAPQPAAATFVSPSTKVQGEQAAVDQAAINQAQGNVPTAATPPAQTQAAAPAPAPAAADSSPAAPPEPLPATQHTEAELEAQRARLRQMIQGH